MIDLGKLKIENAALAPMAGFTDSAYRLICKEMGAGLVVSEMISAKALCFGDKKTAELLKFCDSERPVALQLFGDDGESVRKAAELLMPYNPDIIDINMGCPVPKIVGSGCGSALLKKPKTAAEIVSKTVKAVSVPVSVKIRIGWDKDSVCGAEFAKMLEDSGAAFITVHGRTREQMYAPSVNIDAIAEVKAAVKIPVIANGDIYSAQDAQNMIKQTGCDLVMVGRGALGNPFIFKKLAEGDNYCEPTCDERLSVIQKLADLEIKNKGERLAFLELRRHLPFFFKGIRDAAEIRRRSCTVSNKQEFDALLEYVKAQYKNGEENK